MTLFDRLLLREILVPLGVGLLAILQLLVILQLLQLNEVVFGGAVSLADLGRLTAALAPHFLVVAAPPPVMPGAHIGPGPLGAHRGLPALRAPARDPTARNSAAAAPRGHPAGDQSRTC